MVTLTSIGQAQCANSRLNKLLVECAVNVSIIDLDRLPVMVILNYRDMYSVY